MTRTLVVIHPGAIGDVLLALPAIQRLRAKYPEYKMVLAARASIGVFLLNCGVVDDWISIEGTEITDLFAGCVSSRWFDDVLRRCDVAVVWFKDEDQAIRRVLERYGVQQIRIGSPFDAKWKARHQSDLFLESIGYDEVCPLDDTRLELPAEIIQQGRDCLIRHGIRPGQPFVVIHPGSGSRFKCLKPEILAETIQQLQIHGKQTVLIEGPADQEAVEALCRLVLQPIRVIQGVDLSTVAGVLRHAQLYIGHDSGMTHLSAVLGTPTLAIFGPTDPARWAPRGSHVRVLREIPCTCVSWEEVRRCDEKRCLAIRSPTMMETCVTLEELAGSCL